MQQHNEYQSFKSKTSLKEILDLAIEFERAAHDFYQHMIPKVSKNIRYLVEELAAEELQHFDLFKRLHEREDMQQQLLQMVDTPIHNSQFSDCIHLPELGDKPDDQGILQYALKREHSAMEQYTSLAQSSPQGDIKNLFKFLANEESKHKSNLERVYYEVVHSGGV